ncbi:MAG: hypothetical protein QM500_04415 [Methylococcales bacterium]
MLIVNVPVITTFRVLGVNGSPTVITKFIIRERDHGVVFRDVALIK